MHSCNLEKSRKRAPPGRIVDSSGQLNKLSRIASVIGSTIHDGARYLGASVLSGQARSIANQKKPNVWVAAIGEFRLIEAFFEKLKQSDPTGTYLLIIEDIGTSPLDAARRFKEYIIFTSAAKAFFRPSQKWSDCN